MRTLWGLVLGCGLLGAGCASAPPPELTVEWNRFGMNERGPFMMRGGLVKRPFVPMCGVPGEVQLCDLLEQVAAQLGISIVVHPDVTISASTAKLRNVRDWRPWLRDLLAPHPARLVRIGEVWMVEPSPELGPTLKELTLPEGKG